ncbi:hypothetical protein RUM43_007750 [Polyplax serrata]|uniref:C2H2-type domain-containing protein n=1 Tax=Polyplax serrata TaxID=468196 RepID=A0AAN8PN76_POLSC
MISCCRKSFERQGNGVATICTNKKQGETVTEQNKSASEKDLRHRIRNDGKVINKRQGQRGGKSKIKDENCKNEKCKEITTIKEEDEFCCSKTMDGYDVLCKVEIDEECNEDKKKVMLNYEGVSCKECNQQYSSKHNLKRHVYNVHRMTRVKCPVCEKEVNKKSLDRHMKSIHIAKIPVKREKKLVPEEDKIPCMLCNRKYPSLVSLQNHIRKIHEAEQLKCSECDFTGTRRHLDKHIKKQHNGEVYQCQRCQKILKSKSTLKEHMWIHTEHRRFICDICGMRFKRTSNYHGHLKSHQEKKFQCQRCGHFFLRKRYLAIHEQTIHNYYGDGVPSQEKGYQCEVCGVKLKWKNNLLAHMRIHTGEKPYKCKICEETFTCHGSLRTHMGKHAICPVPSDVSNIFNQQAYPKSGTDSKKRPTSTSLPEVLSKT